jgi:two-component system chemotaxis response regulator CheB
MTPAGKKIKVLLVDDSALVRSMFERVLGSFDDIEVVAGAKDPFEAREKIIQHRPNVIILDIEMPRMDGVTFLKKLRAHYPVPVIMCSGLTRENSRLALEAMSAGAVDVVAKPSAGGSSALRGLGEELAEKIHAAAVSMTPPPAIPAAAPRASSNASFRAAGLNPARYIIALGASTGGTDAIDRLLRQVPADYPPIAIVQHMPEGFTASFAERLNGNSALKVSEAVDGDVLSPGTAFVARGGVQMEVRSIARQAGAQVRFERTGQPPLPFGGRAFRFGRPHRRSQVRRHPADRDGRRRRQGHGQPASGRRDHHRHADQRELRGLRDAQGGGRIGRFHANRHAGRDSPHK